MRSSLIMTSAALLFVAPLAGAASPMKDGEATQSWTIPAVGGGQRLDIQLKTGAGLSIAAWDREEVSVESDWDETRCRDARIEVRKTDQGVLIESTYPPGTTMVTYSCSFHIVVKVPRDIDVHLRSAGGEVAIRGVHGEIRGHTGGGGIDLDGLSGSVNLLTGGGEILVRDCDLDGRLTTGGGSVRFDNVRGGITATSGSVRGVTRARSRARSGSI